ncbi:anti-sigma factor domain-containing protein [Desulfallas thermosapovorans]|uniref:Anti-sigma factor-like protein n=1 Tax=Desulfallas thermosapovorans DSM 6562 TaxID=1121431 RepID=A0A5S5A0B5_9FIRM|nr:anti-sigma factor domain-containing protein [Desulfallas thermosapovorans]TYO97930.1 anti-sigma factor-like protein [Desulfallas thermosapovorans DSM 6562]
MGPNRGLVMEVKKRSCIVLTGDGQFLEVSKPRKGAEVGQEISISRPVFYRFKASYWAVASFLVVALAWLAFNSMLPRAVAYVALDINPSVELGINGDNIIVSARGVDDDGKELLQRVNVMHDPLADGVQKIIAGCIEYQYLNPEKENLVLATVTKTKGKAANKNSDKVKDVKEQKDTKDVHDYIYNSISNSINKSGIKAEIIMADTDLDTMKKAREHGVSPGRYLLQQEAQKKGVQITNQELKEGNIRVLEANKNIRVGDLITKQSRAGSAFGSGDMDEAGKRDKINKPGQSGDKPGKPGKSGDKTDKHDKRDNPGQTIKKNLQGKNNQYDGYNNLNRPVSWSPGKDDAVKNNRGKINDNKSNQDKARGKNSSPRDITGYSGKTNSTKRNDYQTKKDHARQKKVERDEWNKTDREDNDKKNKGN